MALAPGARSLEPLGRRMVGSAALRPMPQSWLVGCLRWLRKRLRLGKPLRLLRRLGGALISL